MGKNYSVYLADLVGDVEGHFYIMQVLSKIENASYVNTCEHKVLFKKHPLKGIRERFRIYNHVLHKVRKKNDNKIIHFLTGDKLYFLPILFSPERKNCKVILTLHRCPSHPILLALLRNFARKISRVVVLSESIAKKLESAGISNVHVIEHPSFYDYSSILAKEKIRNNLGISTDKIVISALGGTRYDKGLDILLDSFAYLNEEIKKKIFLNLVGRPQDFKLEYIMSKIISNHIQARVELRNVTDTEFCENIKLSDWIALPYRKEFTGVSGPMVEAISQGIPCIVPSEGILHSFCSKYNAAIPFESEKADSLAEAIKEIVLGNKKIHPTDTEQLNSVSFIQKHIELYENMYK